LPVASWTFADFDKQIDKVERVDLAVTDLHGFVEDETSQQRFRQHEHELFVEVKYFPAGGSKTWRYAHERNVPSVLADANRLARHLERTHCRLAACLVVDDEGLFAELYDKEAWPAEVKLLLANPDELARRGIEPIATAD
jgi:hypothetical protein